MLLDVDDYMDCLDTLDLTREQKEEIIRVVWSFMEAEVDRAFGLHPVQKCCGHAVNDNLQSPSTSLDLKLTSKRFNDQSAANDEAEVKGVSNG